MSRNDDEKFVEWARLVKERDEFKCQICGKTGGRLESHHLNAWNAYPEERYLLKNGITICKQHHDMFHEIFQVGNNTEFQFKQYIKTIEIFNKIVKG